MDALAAGQYYHNDQKGLYLCKTLEEKNGTGGELRARISPVGLWPFGRLARGSETSVGQCSRYTRFVTSRLRMEETFLFTVRLMSA